MKNPLLQCSNLRIEDLAHPQRAKVGVVVDVRERLSRLQTRQHLPSYFANEFSKPQRAHDIFPRSADANPYPLLTTGRGMPVKEASSGLFSESRCSSIHLLLLAHRIALRVAGTSVDIVEGRGQWDGVVACGLTQRRVVFWEQSLVRLRCVCSNSIYK